MHDSRDSKRRILRHTSVLLALASLGTLASACATGEPHTEGGSAPKQAGGVARSQQALAGLDGVATITAAGTVVNRYTALAANAAQSATSIQVASVAALAVGADALAAGDLLLVMQMQGAAVNTTATNNTWGQVTALNGAGLYEFVEVLSVNSTTNTVTLSCALRNAYTVTGPTQVVRVPQYDSLTVQAGATITAPAWDGAVGGVVAVHARTTVNLAGDITATALGFRGGIVDNMSASSATDTAIFASASAADGARKGEGIAGLLTQFGRAPAANGGGGGNAHNGGGGGGANGKSGGAWTGQGVFDLTLKGGATAWPLLEPNYSPIGSEGGGRGGYSYSNVDLNALVVGPGKATWGGNQRRERGGLGGHPVDNDPATRVFLGGGGGAGDGNDGNAGRGGNGGGLVIVMAGTVSGAGRILANGEAGVNAVSTDAGSDSGDSPGGGGGGGTVIVRATSVTGVSVQARGGAGGIQIIDNDDEAEGPGGGGGGGFVSVPATVTVDVSGGTAGSTTSPALTEFPANGATVGGTGQALLGAAATGAVPYCVDGTVPTTSILSRPTNPTADTTGDFTFGSNDAAATFECRLGAAAFAACSATFATAALVDGSYTLEVRARDLVGNVDATPESYTWLVDTVAPNTTIVLAPAPTSGDTTGDFTFTSSEAGGTFECSVDGAAFAVCTTPFATLALGNGPHTFAVRARDAAGNVDATPATHAWTIDNSAPDTTIVLAPADPTADTTGDFTFTSTKPGTFECALDGGAFVLCTTPFATAALGNGPHTFAVRARDLANNVDATPDTHTWVIDTAPPETTIVTGPAAVTADATGDFTFTSSEASGIFECSLDNGAFVLCTTPHVTATLATGSHTFAVRARDAAGNVDATPAIRTWLVDTTAPDTTIVTGPSNPTSDPTGDFTFTSSEVGGSFECSLDSGAFVACTTPHATAPLVAGSHTFAVRALDALGNADATPATRTWVVNLDSDADGLGDDVETGIGTNPQDADTDDDGVPDGAEADPGVDSDDDGLVNARDPDSDNDGIFDGTERGVTTAPTGTDLTKGHFVPDADPSTTTDPLDADTDDGGLTDGTEDPNHDGEIDAGERDPNDPLDDVPAVTDSDGDGLSNGEETSIGTNPQDADSDDDGVLDGDEPNHSDDSDGDGLINPLDPDSDDDGLFDGTELGLDCDNPATQLARQVCVADADGAATTTSPLDPDSDGGGVRDGSEDANLNGGLDAGERDPTAGHGSDDASVTDTDSDGLSDGTETTIGSNPNDADSDDDGVRDGDEPNPSADGDSDGLVNVLDVDSDNDGLLDGTELGKGCSDPATDAAANHCRADADPLTRTSAVDPDSDGGGVRDGSEDADLDGQLDGGESDPTEGEGADDAGVVDSDDDGLSNGTEATLGSDPNDKDSDDDGLLDGEEPNPSDDRDGDSLIDVLDADSDGDDLFDGTEAGKDCANADTDAAQGRCIADADTGATTTFVLVRDTDKGGVADGDEDSNHNGARGPRERDPLDPADDSTITGEGGAGGAGGAGVGAEAGLGGGDSGGAGGAGGEAGSPAAGAGGDPGTGGSGGSSGNAGAGGTLGTGGNASGGMAPGTGGGVTEDKIVILGGGLCAFRPASGSGSALLLAASALAVATLRRRKRR
jgi:hypothetical protein